MKKETVITELKSAAFAWVEQSKLHMQSSALQDASDLLLIASFLQNDRVQAARDKAAQLDTIVREELPDSFFLFLQQRGVEW